MGMRVVQGAGRATVTRTAAGLQVELANGETLQPQKVIFAAGRVGNTDGLGLDAAGVATDERGRIIVDEQFGTTANGIYAAGDVIGPPALASVSMEQARVAACWAFDIPLKRSVDILPPFGVYSVPEVAMVGLTEEAAAAQGISCAAGRARFETNTRAAISGATEGMVKLVFARADLTVLWCAHRRRRRYRTRPSRSSRHPLRRHHRLLHSLDLQRAHHERGVQVRRLRRTTPGRAMSRRG